MDEGPSQSNSLLASEGIPLFAEPEALLSSSEEYATGPSPENAESSTNPLILFLEYEF
jgi:hypothetical protein